MSRMVPPFYDEDTTSNAEKNVFIMAENLSDDFTVLHSLGLARHLYKTYSEIDFVVISKRGVLVLEVKGGRVSRKGGVWTYKDRYGAEGQSAEGPFKQAISAMHSLRKELEQKAKRNREGTNILFGCGVVFPDIEFTESDPEIIPDLHSAHL